MRLRGLPPVIDARAQVLILGSFPSTASLAAGQYYAHKQNQFWRIVGAVIGQRLPDMDYPQRIVAVQAAGIAIWDVFGSCEREGSLDSAIREAQPNDLAGLQKSAQPLRAASGLTVSQLAVRRVCFNGRMAAKQIRKIEALGFETRVLPSTSPANAGMCFEDKLRLWREALNIAGNDVGRYPAQQINNVL
jgi:hypoxanthine-DNA glycosylase